MTIWCKEIADQIVELIASNEYDNKEICKAVGITETTLYEWINDERKAEFAESIKKAKLLGLGNIGCMAKKALVQKIKGYDYEEVSVETETLPNGTTKVKSVKKTQKHVPPSDTAIIFSLKNSDPEIYRDRHEMDITNKPPTDVNKMLEDIQRMSKELGIKVELPTTNEQ